MKVVELFAGVGGFRLGLENASNDFITIWANQWEPGKKNQFAFDCYNSHFFGTSINVNEDIAIVKDNVPEHDLLVGGFPCQDYSVASTNAKGIEGKKGVLWWSIYHIIQTKKPKYVLLENVDRIVRSPVNQRGRDFAIILRCFADEGYNVEWRVVNAAEYGLQQRRRRTFIFASRKDVNFASTYECNNFEEIISKDGFFAKVFPIKEEFDSNKSDSFTISIEKYSTLVEVSNTFAEHFRHAGVMHEYDIYTRDVVSSYEGKTTNLGDILQKNVDECYYNIDENKWKYMKGSKKSVRTRKDGSTYNYSEGSIPFPDILNRPGRTMLTSEGSVNRSSHLIEDPETKRLRILTPIECERLNGFPDNWTNTGMSNRQRYFTMGNALVVQLITMMGKRIMEIDS